MPVGLLFLVGFCARSLHTTLRMISRYTHAMPKNLRTAVDSFVSRQLPSAPKIAIANPKPSLTVGLLPRTRTPSPPLRSSYRPERQKRANSLLEPKECDRITGAKLLKGSGGGDKTRTEAISSILEPSCLTDHALIVRANYFVSRGRPATIPNSQLQQK